VVLSASRLSQPLSEAPNAMTVIDRQMIKASGSRVLADVFNLVPGMYVSYYKGSQPIVSYHGSTDQYARSMQVMIDGRSVYMPPTSTVDWASLPVTLDDIERIEVIRGPAAASYGANSVHGVINIITRDAGDVHGTTVSVRRGNRGINDVTGQFGNHSENFDYRTTLAYTADNGYDERTPTHLPSFYQADMNNSNDSNQARLMNYRATYYANPDNDFDIQLGYNRDIQGVGFWDSHAQLNPTHDLIGVASFQQVKWTHHLENASDLSVRLSHTRNAYWERYVVPTTGTPVDKSLAADRSTLEIQHTLPVSDSNRLVYGFATSTEQSADSVYFPLAGQARLANKLQVQTSRLFLHDEMRFTPSLLANVGGMYESDGQGSKQFSPRATLNYHVTPTQTVRIGGSVAYRTPSMVENTGASSANYQVGDRLVSGTVSQHLTSEKMLSREIGYLGEFHEIDTSLDVRAFLDQFGHVIYPTNVGFSNGLSGVYHGVEATLKKSFGESANVTFNYAHEQAYSNAIALQGGTLDLLSYSTPANTMSLLYAQSLANDFSYSIAYYQQSGMQGFDRGAGDFQRLHRRTDIRLAQGFKNIVGLDGDIAWVVQNLFKDNYTEYVATNVFNQRTYVTLTLHW
jgi:iron complex outermembrane receptor protein